MLKAYSYYEETSLNIAIKDEQIFNEEKLIAADFVESNPSFKSIDKCVICNSNDLKHFATISNAVYFRCCDCHSIFTPVSEEILSKYKTYEPLVALRNSEKYQSMATNKRSRIWDEMVFWIQFRCARYLHKDYGLTVYNYGNQFSGLSKKISEAEFCGKYVTLSDSTEVQAESDDLADVLLYLDRITLEADTTATLQKIGGKLKPGGLLVMSTRVGSGFDILTLKGGIDNIIPYDHTVLPSIEGLEIAIINSGYQLLEISTPGAFDVQYVLGNKDRLDAENLFINYMIQKSDNSILLDFQRFLQKSGLSSHARVIAKKV